MHTAEKMMDLKTATEKPKDIYCTNDTRRWVGGFGSFCVVMLIPFEENYQLSAVAAAVFLLMMW